MEILFCTPAKRNKEKDCYVGPKSVTELRIEPAQNDAASCCHGWLH